MTGGKDSQRKETEMTHCCTKETVSPVSKKQGPSPSEQSLWNKDSLQTFVHNQSKSIQCLNCLNAVSFQQQPFKGMSMDDFEVTILFFFYMSGLLSDPVIQRKTRQMAV